MNSKESKAPRGLARIVDMRTFLPAAIILVIFSFFGIVYPEQFAVAADAAMKFVTEYFSWWYSLLIMVFVFICVWIVASPKVGGIRFGGKNAKPEFSFFTWASITLTSTIANGILFYGVAEPVTNFLAPPIFSGYAGGSAEAAENALKYAYVHWAVQPYALYGVIGAALGFMYWNCKRKYHICSALYPIIGDKCDGKAGSWVNGLCIFAMIGGMATSFGIGVMQLGTGIQQVFNVNAGNDLLYLVIIIAYAVVFIYAACSGLKKAISVISDVNSYVYIVLLALILFLGGTVFILNNTLTSIGKYINIMISQVFYLEPAFKSGWVGANTNFYWGWWLVFAPVTGIFMIKLAKGRTLREFIVVNTIIPGLFAIVWFGFFGSAGINLELFGNGGIAEAMAEYGLSGSLFALIANLPGKWVLTVLVFIALVLSVITMFESMTLTIADMTSTRVLHGKAGAQSPKGLRVFWGVLIALLSYALLLAGGLNALQTASVVCALPLTILLVFMVWGFVKAMKNPEKYDLTLAETESKNEGENETQKCEMMNVENT